MQRKSGAYSSRDVRHYLQPASANDLSQRERGAFGRTRPAAKNGSPLRPSAHRCSFGCRGKLTCDYYCSRRWLSSPSHITSQVMRTFPAIIPDGISDRPYHQPCLSSYPKSLLASAILQTVLSSLSRFLGCDNDDCGSRHCCKHPEMPERSLRQPTTAGTF